MKELEDAKKLFLSSDIDEEFLEDNREMIADWESDLIKNENFLNWQQHDVTKEIVQRVKESYRDNAIILIRKRDLTETQRASLWAKQDAAIWILSLTEVDAKGAIEAIQNQIKKSLEVS